VSSKLARYRRVSSGQASSCHSEPKGCGPMRLYLFTLCIALCTTAHSDSHYNSCRSHYKLARCAVVRAEAQGTSQQAMQAGHHSSTRSVTGQSVSSWSNTLACVQYSMGTAATTGVAIAPQNQMRSSHDTKRPGRHSSTRSVTGLSVSSWQVAVSTL
jgi:hypothetical protein